MLAKIPITAWSRLFLLAGTLLALPASAPAAEDFEFFENHVRPILIENCYKCHSVTAGKTKGGLLLDSKDALLKGGDNGPAIVPGDPEKSLLVKAVRYIDPDLQMPPKDQKLSAAQVSDLVAWVKMGAPDPRAATNAAAPAPSYDFTAARQQWAFRKPADPAPPAVKNKQWVKSPIDQFILAKLEEKHLAPAPPADKRTLIRRATFDLTGLPPTPAEVNAFLKDKSTNAFARVVDRLLASPRYGERWARHWLDVVRYTDSWDSRSSGDGDISESYRYRDWVVDAFNRDLPYTQFIREQIAGDLLQPSDTNKIDASGFIATGMYAIGNWGNGDADKDKILTDMADDQVDVTGRAFLGLTMACARCHDHKFDPIPTADYYAMAGIFFSSHILPSLTPKGQGENPLFIPLASQGELHQREQREARMAELEKNIAANSDHELTNLSLTVLGDTAKYLQAVADPLHPGDVPPEIVRQWVNYLGRGDLKLLSHVDHDFGGRIGYHVLHNADNADTPAGFINSTDHIIPYLTITLPAQTVAIHPSPTGGVAAGWKSPITGTLSIKGRVADADPNCGDGIAWEITVRHGGSLNTLATGAIPNGGDQDFNEGQGAEKLKSVKVTVGDLVSLVVLPKAEYSCDSTVVEMELTDRDHPKRVWNLSKEVIAAANEAGNPYPDSQGHKGVWSIYDMAGQSPMGEVTAGTPLADWLAAAAVTNVTGMQTAAAGLQAALLSTNASVKKLRDDLLNPRSVFWSGASGVENYFPSGAKEHLRMERKELAALRKDAPGPVPRANGMLEGGVPGSPHAGVHDVKIHLRGRYDHLGDLAPRGFPRLLAGDHQPAITNGSGRLELADWIASADNPMTARVMVNRIWQHHFGEGIVRTPNNYGKLGTPPTHPELLDYLSHRFIDSGWSIKAMHRAIMLSAAYQQSSVPQPATYKEDPDTLLIGRMNRHRLESEALRDSLLAVGGRLDPQLGGPPTPDLSAPRRTLYVKTVRSDRATYQFLFDAADPNAIVEKRIDSTVAPQALFLLNNSFVLTQGKALAGRVIKEAPSSDKARIRWLYELLYARPVTKPELEIGLRALSAARAGSKDRNTGWEDYCQILLCANEFIYVD